MKQEEQVSFGEALADAMIFLVPVAIFIGLFAMRFQYAQEMAKELSHQLSTEQGHIIGTVAEIETWEEENFESKKGNMTVTLEIRDRTRLTFTDGRSKELLGIPKEEVPKDKEVAVTFAAYNVLLEIMDADEYRSREGDGN